MTRFMIAIIFVVAFIAWLLIYLLPYGAALMFSDAHFQQVWRVMYRQVLP